MCFKYFIMSIYYFYNPQRAGIFIFEVSEMTFANDFYLAIMAYKFKMIKVIFSALICRLQNVD